MVNFITASVGALILTQSICLFKRRDLCPQTSATTGKVRLFQFIISLSATELLRQGMIKLLPSSPPPSRLSLLASSLFAQALFYNPPLKLLIEEVAIGRHPEENNQFFAFDWSGNGPTGRQGGRFPIRFIHFTALVVILSLGRNVAKNGRKGGVISFAPSFGAGIVHGFAVSLLANNNLYLDRAISSDEVP